MEKKKVLVAMSGGVDSSAAAAILVEQGYAVEGATMRLFSGNPDAEEDSRKVCQALGIKHHIFDFTDIFEKMVISYFINEYLSGRTPNPCVMCNKHLKFGAFLDSALDMGFDYIATGHYAKIENKDGRYRLLRSENRKKDQSYVLYNFNQHILSHTLFPTGRMDKDSVRGYAKKAGLAVAEKSDSQEICFIPDNDYISFIAKHVPDLPPPGDFVDMTGRIIGKHKGIISYTIGQRKGLGMAFGSPKFVVDIDPLSNRVTLGEDADTLSTALIAENINFISGILPDGKLKVTAKIRYNGPDTPAVIHMAEGNRAVVRFDSPVRAVTAGQTSVFYDGAELLGGGVIKGKI